MKPGIRQTVDRIELARRAANCRIVLPHTVLDPLARYLEMLCMWNAVINLVGFRRWQDIFDRLVCDSFYLADFLEKLFGSGLFPDSGPTPDSGLFWDLGAGAGLPGIPLRLVWNRGRYYLVEIRAKRALFLANAVSCLRLAGTHVFHGSVENFFQQQAAKADCIVSRAFMPWNKLLDVACAGLRGGGMLIVLAGAPAPEMPDPWRLAATHSYRTDGGTRWFWAVSR
ncbi:MAG: ribosomal RNA small subunit methyltransferase G [Candidatus Desulfovibrio kirbyi]|uniref:Ribosomal RNA small subunit methyltransferase G n=1 Tax=Candidatus Desulfovibrio kirbyi TaxID=2696086 RepID=A0A6L2R699_9BACT|nr:MAG: ribosomal RNA small subunit methyltransferase G [Candidatus Desulfovibrio kirbyi]